MPHPIDAGLLARSQYSEGLATGHLDTGFSWFPCVYKQMLRWFPIFQVATTCFSCSPPDVNLVVTKYMFFIHVVKYADDLVLMAKEETVLQGMIDNLIETGRYYGMEMNVEKQK